MLMVYAGADALAQVGRAVAAEESIPYAPAAIVALSAGALFAAARHRYAPAALVCAAAFLVQLARWPFPSASDNTLQSRL